jgi:hypothetical protein
MSERVKIYWSEDVITSTGELNVLEQDVKLLMFDAVLSVGITDTAEISQLAIEQGSPVTDHVKQKPTTVTMDVLATNTPLSAPKQTGDSEVITQNTTTITGSNGVRIKTYEFSAEFNTPLAVHEQLMRLKRYSFLLQVQTKNETFDDMILYSVTTKRSHVDGESDRFTISFQQIKTVNTQYVSIPVAREPRGRSQRKSQTTPLRNSDQIESTRLSESEAAAMASGRKTG